MFTQILVSSLLVLIGNSASVQVADSAQCSVCKSAVSELKVIWEDKDTKDLLALGKTFICANIPIEDCNNWITGQLANLDTLIESLDPTAACTQLTVCTYMTSDVGDSIQCDFCEFLGDELVKRLATNATIDEICEVAEKVCAKLPFVSNECTALVKEYGNYYLELLAGSINVKQLCAEIGLCSADVRHMIEATELFQILKQGIQNDDECKACVDGMDLIKSILNSTDTLDLLHVAVHELCGIIPISGCEAILDTAIDQVIKNYLPMFDPNAICKEIGACPAVDMFYAVANVGVTPLCEACHDALGELKKATKDPDTKNMVDHLAPVICELIEIPFCKSLVTKLLEENLTKIQNLDVDGTCVSLKACDAVGDTPTVEKLGDACSECTMIADEIMTLLKNDEVVNLLKEAIGEVCTILPISNCAQTLDGLLDQLISLIKTMDGKTLCSLLGLCSSVEEVAPVEVRDACSECTTVIDLLLKELQDPSMQQEVEAVLDEVCTILPIPKCKETIHTYMSEIEAIINNLDGKTVCSFLDLCSSHRKEPVVNEVEEVSPIKVGDTCSECTLIAQEILTLLQNDDVDSLLKEGIGELCTILPISDCEQTLDGYFDQLIALLKNMDGKSLCSLLGLCDSMEYNSTDQWFF